MIAALLLAVFCAGIAIWVFRQTDEDVYIVLAIAILGLCFIIGFAHAHWGLQAIIALSLLALDRVYRQYLRQLSEVDVEVD